MRGIATEQCGDWLLRELALRYYVILAK